MLIVWVQSGGTLHRPVFVKATVAPGLTFNLPGLKWYVLVTLWFILEELSPRIFAVGPLELDRANLSLGCLILNGEEEVVPGSPAVWQDLLELDPEDRRNLGAEARSRIEEHYSLDRVVEQYEALYERIAAKPKGNLPRLASLVARLTTIDPNRESDQ